MKQDRSIYTELPRSEIDWFPGIDHEKCKPQQCNFHYVKFCPFGVLSQNASGVIQVSKLYECNVGDESCRFQCPFDAISFPTTEELKEMLPKVRAKYQDKEI